MFAPPPPPPPGGAPPPPAPPGTRTAPAPPQQMLVDPNRFKMVTGLGEALHQAKLKICGEEETPACAEGVSSGLLKPAKRPQSWHGRPQKNRAIIDEMQNKLAARRAKVDKESEPVSAPNIGKPPRPVSTSYAEGRKFSAPAGPPSRGYTPPTDYGPARGRTPSDFGPDWTPVLNRKYSQDSGVASREQSWTPPTTRAQYRRVSVDMERKEELLLAKQVRSTSVKILRMSPGPDSAIQHQKKEEDFSSPNPNVAPPSAVVLRYWNQCAEGNAVDGETELKDDERTVPAWKEDALEGEVTEFPSIKDKIKQVEEGKMVTSVPDVKKKLDLGDLKPAGWMEARKKLQSQLDVLLNKTSAKMATIAKKEDDKNEPEKSLVDETDSNPEESSSKKSYPEVDSHVKSLIKSVANEIQKSFSQRNLDLEDQEEESEENNFKLEVNTDEQKKEKNDGVQETYIDTFIPEEPSLEAPIDFDSVPNVLDTSINREKLKIVRKSSRERRLPASIVAKKKAAEKLREIISSKSGTSVESAELINGPLKDLISPDSKSEEEKVDWLAKEMSKLESNQVLQILQTVEKGILDFSIPLLIPFLSIQVKMSMSKNLYKDMNTEDKTEVMKESIIDSLINDITDIAILQEVIDRSQEKLNSLRDFDKFKETSTQVENAAKKDASTLTDLETIEEQNEKEEKSEEVEPKVESQVSSDTGISSERSSESDTEQASVAENEEQPIGEKTEDVPDSSTKPDSATEPVENEKSDDSGVDSEESNTEEKISKSKSEKDIKKAILNILNDAKKQENTRAVRNYGRTFEFQQTQLKPVIPNDRRPLKARKMDNMWNNQIASKSVNYNGIQTSKPTARVPWTMKSNSNPVKKDSIIYDKEVDEFEKCRSKLNESKNNPSQEKDSSISKNKASPIISKSNSIDIQKDKIGKVKETITERQEDNMIKNEESKDNHSCRENSTDTTKDSFDVKSKTDMVEEIEIEVVSKSEAESIENLTAPTDNLIEAENISLIEDIEKAIEVSTKNDNTKESSEKNKHDPEDSEEISSISSEWEESDTDIETLDEKDQGHTVISSTEEKIVSNETKLINDSDETENETVKPTLAEDEKEDKNSTPVIMTPMTRRRMETAGTTVTIQLPRSGPPPPPPAFRPPPPPVSPPAVDMSSKIQKMLDDTASRFNALKEEVNEKKDPIKNVVPHKTDDSDSGEETEWEEWTEEESEYENEVEPEVTTDKEKWENVLSDSGPTTFSAEFSIKLS